MFSPKSLSESLISSFDHMLPMDPATLQQVQLAMILQDLLFIMVALFINKVVVRSIASLLGRRGINLHRIPILRRMTRSRHLTSFRNEKGRIVVDTLHEELKNKYVGVLNLLRLDYDQLANHLRLLLLSVGYSIHISDNLISGYHEEMEKIFDQFASGYDRLKESYNIYNRVYLDNGDIFIVNEYHIAMVRLHKTGYDVIGGDCLDLRFNPIGMRFELYLVGEYVEIILHSLSYSTMRQYIDVPIIHECMSAV